MNSNNIWQFLQQGFRLTLGATVSLLETIQNPEKRSAILAELQNQLQAQTQVWVEKGEITEAEAKEMINNFLQQLNRQKGNNETSPASPNAPSNNQDISEELQDLTAKIIDLRRQIAELRQNSADSN
ncbi:MAG: hypothetical protein D6756_06820 [Cyanobacteria bacterium J083]|nr:MAG: hypothetical protein D6756_06820 [Cyanobacteria bacterium J083]